MHDATLEPRCPGWTSFGRSPGDGNDLGIPEGKNPRNWMACFNELPSQGPQEPITASGALLSGGLNTDRPGSEQAWTVRVVWISFRPSEPETWVRILHGPPRNMPNRLQLLTPRLSCKSLRLVAGSSLESRNPPNTGRSASCIPRPTRSCPSGTSGGMI